MNFIVLTAVVATFSSCLFKVPNDCFSGVFTKAERSHHPGPVARNSISLTLGWPKFQSNFPNSSFVNSEIFLHKSCLDEQEFPSLKFRNKKPCRNTQTKTVG